MLIAAVNSGLFKTLLMLHILSAIIGFGAVFLNGIYANQIKKAGGVGGLAIADANHTVTNIGEKIIYTVPIWGILLVLSSSKLFTFKQTWVMAALGLYIVAVGVATGLLIPLTKKMRALMAELVAAGPPPAGASAGGPPPQVAQLEEMGKRAALFGAFLNIALVAIVYLMVFKPGY
jgi:uncharacterized membrane protein